MLYTTWWDLVWLTPKLFPSCSIWCLECWLLAGSKLVATAVLSRVMLFKDICFCISLWIFNLFKIRSNTEWNLWTIFDFIWSIIILLKSLSLFYFHVLVRFKRIRLPSITSWLYSCFIGAQATAVATFSTNTEPRYWSKQYCCPLKIYCKDNFIRLLQF